MLSAEQWRVTLQRVRPTLVKFVILLVGLVLGLVWGYGIAPVVWQNAEPVHLEPSYKAEWIKSITDQYLETGDREHAGNMLLLLGDAVSSIDQLIVQNQGDGELVAGLQAVRDIAVQVGADSTNAQLDKLEVGGLQGMNPVVLVIIVLVVGFIAIVLWGMYGLMLTMIVRNLLPSFGRRRRSASTAAEDEASAAQSAVETQRREELQRFREESAAAQAAAAAAGAPVPVAQFPSAYVNGDEFYDDSFSIEDESGGFLGECGAGISETVGVGSPKKVTAIEIWLFDKNDIRTVTNVVMSEHAWNDPSLRAKLEPKGTPALAAPGAQIILETQTLRIIATIRDLEYGEGGPGPNSYFQRLTLDLAAYAKEGATSAPGTAIGDMYGSEYEGTTPL